MLCSLFFDTAKYHVRLVLTLVMLCYIAIQRRRKYNLNFRLVLFFCLSVFSFRRHYIDG